MTCFVVNLNFHGLVHGMKVCKFFCTPTKKYWKAVWQKSLLDVLLVYFISKYSTTDSIVRPSSTLTSFNFAMRLFCSCFRADWVALWRQQRNSIEGKKISPFLSMKLCSVSVLYDFSDNIRIHLISHFYVFVPCSWAASLCSMHSSVMGVELYTFHESFLSLYQIHTYICLKLVVGP